MSPKLRDIIVKTFWTAASAVLGVVLVTVTDIQDEYFWAPIAIAAINALLVVVRQMATGDVPPTAESRPSAA